jgi:hypothetical protein
MEQGCKRRNPRCEKPVDQAAVKIEPLLILSSLPLGQKTGPGHGKSIRADTKIAHQLDIFGVTMVVVAGDVPVLGALDLARSVSERVPNRRAASVF